MCYISILPLLLLHICITHNFFYVLFMCYYVLYIYIKLYIFDKIQLLYHVVKLWITI